MLDYLDKLRAKPVHVRQRIVWVTTGALSLVIAGVWGSTWQSAGATPVAATPTRAPWGVVADTLVSAKQEMAAAVSDAVAGLEQVSAGSVEYTQPKDIPIDAGAADSGDTHADATAVVNDTPAADPAGVPPASEALHVRPKTVEGGAMGTASGNDMLQ